ncbi:hypothetical protein PanWU01x14_302680 [Parasponia andersonii]|uniref:Uncharacterized protein n=1 Tax=Parasponia andersonii TaxID=3476 RepID=A0A2P5ATE3_PARAD|nr:hypothetical protein PanWU01x14_302680 [Parasponia andersonii]
MAYKSPGILNWKKALRRSLSGIKEATLFSQKLFGVVYCFQCESYLTMGQLEPCMMKASSLQGIIRPPLDEQIKILLRLDLSALATKAR